MAWTEADQATHDRIVHQLRSQGWSREDAHEEADKRTARMIERREAAARHTTEGAE